MLQIKQISVQELKEKFSGTQKFQLIDCREPDEYEFCRIDGSTLIPLSQFSQEALSQLKPEEDIVVHCHHGGRSQRACEFLAANGYKKVSNLSGGIDAWSLKIDSKVPRY